ncbi:MAG: O-antigen ligase family protein [Bryobacteraceae bacterium]|nr:O-antigen ligase family protein [Bryobacteraceae bacterium]MDW8380247.1 O-antigen ligase family protein [Bryobacterales bacterium]
MQFILLALLTGSTLTMWVAGWWAQCLFELAIFVFAAYLACRHRPGGSELTAAGLFAVPALWGAGQLAFGVTVDGAATLQELLQWTSLAATAFCAGVLARRQAAARPIIVSLALAGCAIVVFALVQFYSSAGHFFWRWPSGEPQVFGPFHSRNNFASFCCLILPLTLWRSVQKSDTVTLWVIFSAILVSGAVVSGSRAGAFLAIAETIVFLFWLPKRRLATPRHSLALLAAVSLAVVVVGWDTLAGKINQQDPLRYRREIAQSALAMLVAKPWTGFGLGTFSQVYPAYAKFDTGLLVNHAHQEWLEFASEGGVVLGTYLAVLAIWLSRLAVTHLWAVGIPALCLHSLVDYPFQRNGIAAWVSALAGILVFYSRQRSQPPCTPGAVQEKLHTGTPRPETIETFTGS